MRNKATRNDVVSDVLILLGGGLKIMIKLINTIYETGEWPKEYAEVTMIVLKKKPQATKCSDHCTTSLITHTPKILRRNEREIQVYLEISFDLKVE